MAEKVKKGEKFFIFPEGQYGDNYNIVFDFRPGEFKCSIKSEAPIVPVALIDSYKVFGINSLRKIKTQVHFIEPIYFKDYKDLSTSKIADFVKTRIVEAIEKAVG